MLALFQEGFAQQWIGAEFGKLLCVTDQTVISHQFIVIAGSVVGDGMWRAGVVTTGTQLCLIAMRQPMRKLLNITGMLFHWNRLLLGNEVSLTPCMIASKSLPCQASTGECSPLQYYPGMWQSYCLLWV